MMKLRLISMKSKIKTLLDLSKKTNNIGMHVKHVFDRVNRLNQNMFVAHLCTTNISVVCPSKAEPASQEAAWDVSEVKKSGKNGSKQGCI